MRFQAKTFSLIALAFAVSSIPAAAQFPTGRFGKDGVEIRVSYSLQVPLKDDKEETQTEAMEQGRRMLYDMSAKECDMILSAIAKSCRLEGLNIQSNVQRNTRSREMPDTLNLSANARFRIELKPAEKPKDEKAESGEKTESEKADTENAKPDAASGETPESPSP